VMVKTSNHNPDRAAVCQKAINEWNNIKKKSVDDIDNKIQDYMATPFNLYDI
ncbi:7920_t:CDS:1, partial [Funneliformis geosporum]